MNLQMLSAIAQIISSIAVLLTLVYLAIQTNQLSKQTELNTAAILSSSRQEILNQELWILGKGIENPLFIIGREAVPHEFLAEYNLSIEDRSMLLTFYNAVFRIRENLWLQYTSGVLDEKTWNSYRTTFVRLLNLDTRMKTYWSLISQMAMDKGFVNEINSESKK